MQTRKNFTLAALCLVTVGLHLLYRADRDSSFI